MTTSRPPLVERAAWIGRAEELFGDAMQRIRMLGSMAPRNAHPERLRLIAEYEAGNYVKPRWSYVRTDHASLRKLLEEFSKELDTEGTPLARVYAERGRELALEAALASAAGETEMSPLAVQRFSVVNADEAAEATSLARSWIAEKVKAPPDYVTTSDGLQPGSLVFRMKEAVGRLHLPFSVVVQSALASLAATGERSIVIAAGRPVTEEDVRRTVLHEIEAHAMPRARAALLKMGIFSLGTARGSDEQEGFALVLEERHGFLTCRRRRELAARHVAVETMHEGATFVDVAKALTQNYGFSAREAIVVSERAFRGGDGERPGLGRERVYLESFLRVKKRLLERPTDEAVLASGQVAVDAIAAVSPFVTSEKRSHVAPGS